MKKNHTKGTFKDGHTGWKVGEREANGVKGFEIHYSDAGECVTDHVYTREDAVLISVAPDLLNECLKAFDLCDKIQMPTEQELASLKESLSIVIKKATE